MERSFQPQEPVSSFIIFQTSQWKTEVPEQFTDYTPCTTEMRTCARKPSFCLFQAWNIKQVPLGGGNERILLFKDSKCFWAEGVRATLHLKASQLQPSCAAPTELIFFLSFAPLAQ